METSWTHWFPLVGWAERGGYLADGHGNSVPRFHVTRAPVVVMSGGIGGNFDLIRQNWPDRLGPPP